MVQKAGEQAAEAVKNYLTVSLAHQDDRTAWIRQNFSITLHCAVSARRATWQA